jgi:hypothetical protein
MRRIIEDLLAFGQCDKLLVFGIILKAALSAF